MPQFDLPGGPPLIAGGQFLSQCRAGVLDGATWTLSKGFFTVPAPGAQLDTSPGLVPWWAGVTDQINVGRSTADVTLDEATALLNIQMPRNMIQAGCVHTFCDAGCTLLKSNNTYSGQVSSVTAPNILVMSPASYPAHYFDLGIMTFNSGVLNGASFTVSYSATGGIVATILPFPTAPAPGDTFTVLVGCDKSVATCSGGKFKLNSGAYGSNLIHYRGAPFVPNPETLYDGGTGSQTYTSIGAQGKPFAGSPFTGKTP